MFRLWCGISTIAACLQRKTYLELMSLTVYPNMYIVLTGYPATRKGTAMEPVEKFLNELQINVAASKTSTEALIKSLAEANMSEVDLQTGGLKIHSSMTIISKELTVFFGYDNKSLLSTLCDWFDCGPKFKYNTIGRGMEEIIGVWVNLLGATTPNALRESLPAEAIGGGLTSRTIFVCEERKGKLVVFPYLDPARENDLIHDLAMIKNLSGPFHYTEEFVDIYTDWRVRWDDKQAINDQSFIHYNDRRPIHLLKLCIIMSASRGSDMLITAEDINRAIDILERTEQKMPLAFRGMGSNEKAEITVRIMTTISSNKEIYMRDLLKLYIYDVRDKEELFRIVSTLAATGFCRVVLDKENTKVIYTKEGYYADT